MFKKTIPGCLYIQNRLIFDVFYSVELLSQCAVACIDNWRCESFSHSSLHKSCLLSESVADESGYEYDVNYDSYLRQDVSLSQVVNSILTDNCQQSNTSPPGPG